MLHFINVFVFVLLKILSRGHEPSDWTQSVDKIAITVQLIMIFITEIRLRDKNKFSNKGRFLYTLSAVLAFLLFSFYSESTAIEDDDDFFCRIRLISILSNQMDFSNRTICELFEIGSLIVFLLLLITDILMILYSFHEQYKQDN